MQSTPAHQPLAATCKRLVSFLLDGLLLAAALPGAAATIPTIQLPEQTVTVLNTWKNNGQVSRDPDGSVNHQDSKCTPKGLGGGSPALFFSLTHNSKVGASSRWGYGWSTDWDESLLLNPDGSIQWTDGDGAERIYVKLAPAAGSSLPRYLEPVNTYTTLTALQVYSLGEPTSLRLRHKDGTLVDLQRQGATSLFLPTLLTDRNGNTVTYNRDSTGKLLSVVDVHGRSLSMSYNSAGKVTSVTDSAGRPPASNTTPPGTRPRTRPRTGA